MGAWTQTYHKGLTGQAGTPLGYAIQALKAELDYNGYGAGLSLSGFTFGDAMTSQTRSFQHAYGLSVDGIIGPLTAKALYRRRFGVLETNYGIPDDIVCKGCSLESAVDPGAVGVVDLADHGIMQLNALAHPEITLTEAFTPKFALDYYAKTLRSAYDKFQDWDCAIAAWNVGGGSASDWCSMHKPAHGGPPWFPTLFERATAYVALVKGQQC